MDQLFYIYIRTSPTEVVTELMCVGCDKGCGTCHLFTMLFGSSESVSVKVENILPTIQCQVRSVTTESAIILCAFLFCFFFTYNYKYYIGAWTRIEYTLTENTSLLVFTINYKMLITTDDRSLKREND